MACYNGLGNLAKGKHLFWIGDFDGDGQSEILFYHKEDHQWWIASHIGGQLQWSLAGNTGSFGQIGDLKVGKEQPFWVGRFSQKTKDEIIFHNPNDGNWWLGTINGTQLTWTLAGNTNNFGNLAQGEHLFWIGDFDGDGQSEILFYFKGDRNWWIASHIAGQLQWSLAGNTNSFGQIGDLQLGKGQPFWVGRFSQKNKEEMIFHNPDDGNWWLGTINGIQLSWALASNTNGFGKLGQGKHLFWIGDFDGDGQSEILFYYKGDSNWWIASHIGGQLQWSLAGNTNSFGQIGDLQLYKEQPFWVGAFSRTTRLSPKIPRKHKDEILFYNPNDGNWWLGAVNGTQLAWTSAGNTSSFGNLAQKPYLFWKGKFSQKGRDEVLFYYVDDGNWWLGSHNGSILNWTLAGNTGRPFRASITVHFKTLEPNAGFFINNQINGLKEIFEEKNNILVNIASFEDLSGNTTLTDLRQLDTKGSWMGLFGSSWLTEEQKRLFGNRNGVGKNEIVVYVVNWIDGDVGVEPMGQAIFPAGKPNVVLRIDALRYVLTHEIGHVLGLDDVENPDRVMHKNIFWTRGRTPDFTSSEVDAMIRNEFTNECN